MKLTKSLETKVVKETTVGYKCDNCGLKLESKKLPEGWHSFESGHNEWGNDSAYSVEKHDVCSPECLVTRMSWLLNNGLKDILDGSVSGMSVEFAKYFVEYVKEKRGVTEEIDFGCKHGLGQGEHCNIPADCDDCF